MNLELFYTAGLIILLVLWWMYEYTRHKKHLKKIKIRIHVNGTRGKSSVSRLIAGAFREAGFKTLCKTTGTFASIIFPDGHEELIQRRGAANIREQLKLVELAGKLEVDALIIECMALQPFYQEIGERKMIKAHAGVITNARADHLDVMGPTELDVVDALCGMIPKNGVVITAEEKHYDKMLKNANKIKAQIIQSDKTTVTDEELLQFSYVEHAENVALVYKVAEHFGIDKETAFRGMLKTEPDKGALKYYSVPEQKGLITFANAFAANDPESTLKVWDLVCDRFSCDQRFVIINNREDRQTRTMQLAEFSRHLHADHFFLVGTATEILKSLMVKAGIAPDRISDYGGKKLQKLYEAINTISKTDSLSVGIGNIGGAGHEVVAEFENRGKIKGDVKCSGLQSEQGL